MNLQHLKVFGCQAVIHIPKEKRKKLDAKGKEVIFIKYCTQSKSYHFYDVKKKEVIISQDAVFHEQIFPKDGNTNDTSYCDIFTGYDSVGNEDKISSLNSSNEIPIEISDETISENSFLDAQDDFIVEESSEGIILKST
ncbi:uncharacterized protein LOC129939464 [Eupeodes corollae]|uniref:uncharacterized protein LOC129939464 n=1 Tax=Eupeodes corollae TaxID=290404 RepID=UPI002491BF6E|nr:uncharacterized protein LOC129939464 [Eupeodes corollae]